MDKRKGKKKSAIPAIPPRPFPSPSSEEEIAFPSPPSSEEEIAFLSPPSSSEKEEEIAFPAPPSSEKEEEVANPDPEKRPWSDLHTDHLMEIVQRLDVKEYIRFSITCNNWRSVPEPPHPGDRRMRLMQIRNRDGACDFIDPTSNKTHHAEFPELAGVKV